MHKHTNTKIALLNRRQFIRGAAGIALALPCLESFAADAKAAIPTNKLKRFAAIYFPNGVGMPLREDPAFTDWSWFPHGAGKNYRMTKVLEPLEPLRDEFTIFSGLSHPAVRNVHGHSNADQFLTGADTGGHGPYKNSISLDQVFAAHAGEHTRFSSLVLSINGGTGGPRGATTCSFNQQGRPIPALDKPKQAFDHLFVAQDKDAARKLAMSTSALDDLLEDARSLHKQLSKIDQDTLTQYLDAVRDTEVKIEKAKKWLETPIPQVHADDLHLDVTPNDPRTYVQTMYDIIYLAFLTDSTRVATFQMGRENGGGIHDQLAMAVGLNQAHQLTHETKKPGGWKNLGLFNRFLNEEYGRFISKLKNTEEPGLGGNMLDNTVVLIGSASSAFHTSRNYPLILAGGKNMGFQHGQFLKYGKGNENNQADADASTDKTWQSEMTYEELPLSNLYLSMLHKLGVEAASFGGSSTTLSGV